MGGISGVGQGLIVSALNHAAHSLIGGGPGDPLKKNLDKAITLENIFMMKFSIIVLISCLAYIGCIDVPKTGVKQASRNIEESKSLGVFIAEYNSKDKFINGNNKKYHIEDVWIEKSWWYKDVHKNIEIGDYSILYVSVDDDLFEEHLLLEPKENVNPMGKRRYKLQMTFLNSTPSDTIAFKLTTGQELKFYKVE